MLNKVIIAVEIVFFNIFGVFGNVNFIFLTMTRKSLKSKSSYLQCILCFSHIICLLFELPNAILLFTGLQIKRNVCFPAISIYIFFSCAQELIILMMTIDILIIVYLPSFYRTTSTCKYLIGMLTVPVFYSAALVTWGFLAMDDEVVMFCNPPVGLPPTVSKFWSLSNIVINTIILTFFIALLLIFSRKNKKPNSRTTKVMQRLKISIFLFICSWYIASLAIDLFAALGFTGETLSVMVSHLVFFVLISFTQSFYVVIWRSSEYRTAFFEAWSWIPLCRSLKEKHGKQLKISTATMMNINFGSYM